MTSVSDMNMVTLASETCELKGEIVRIPHTQYTVMEHSKHSLQNVEEQEVPSVQWSSTILKSC